MHTNINYLSAEHAAAVKQLATNIAAQVKVTAIVLYGMRTHGSLIWSAPNMLAPAPQPIGLTVDLLVITQKGEKKNATEVIRLIEDMQTPALNITCIVHTALYIRNVLATPNLFFNRIQQEGMLVWGSWPFPPIDPADIQAYINHADTTFRRTFKWIWKLSEDAEKHKYRELSADVLPKLRQAAKACATGILWILTGHRPVNRSLLSSLLLLQNIGFDYRICFDQRKEKDEQLFPLLYENTPLPQIWENKRIQTEDLSQLMELVSNLIGWAYDFTEDRIDEWKDKMEAETQGRHPTVISKTQYTIRRA